MNDPRYNYDKVNVIKMILVNSESQVLLIKEPATNEWMPNHWGLPGGKALVKESLLETVARKAIDDLGLASLTTKGLFKIEELLMENKTAFIYHVVADVPMFRPQGEIAKFKWVSKEDITEMKTEEFTEYFNRKLLLDFFSDPESLIPLTVINSLPYYNFTQNIEYQLWLQSGKRK